MIDSVDERTRALERYAAGVLEFDAVLGLVAAHATTAGRTMSVKTRW